MTSTGRVSPVQEFCTSEQNEVNNICRLCGQCRRDVISIFSEEAHRKHVLLKIQTRLLIQISASDPLPKNACANCLEKLDSFWDFTELCRKTQTKLQEKFLKQRRNEQAALWKDDGNVGTSHLSFAHQTTQDTSDSASGNKRRKLEHVLFIKEERVCLDENSCANLTSTTASSAGSQVSYRNASREVSAEPSRSTNISVKLDHQQKSDTMVKNFCLSEMVDAIVSKNMQVLQDCGIGGGRSAVSLGVENHWKAVPSDLNESSLGQQGRLHNVIKTEPIIDEEATLNPVNSNAVQNHYRKISAQSSSNSNINVRSDFQQESNTTVKKLCLDETIGRNLSLLQDCDSAEGIDGSVSMKMSDYQNSFSVFIHDSLEEQGNFQDVPHTKPASINQARVLSLNTEASNFQLDRGENITLKSLLYVHGNSEKEGRATLQKEGTDTHVRNSVSQEGIKSRTREEKWKFSASSNAVSVSDTMNNCGKLRGEGDRGDDRDSSDCDNSFSCHDCGSTFSCKNSLADHISKQHNHAGQTKTLHATPPTTVTLDCLDSSINNLSSSDVVSAPSGNVLQKPEKNNKSLLAQGRPKEDAPSVDDNDKEDTDNHVKSCVPREGILEDSASNNIILDSDTEYSFSKLCDVGIDDDDDGSVGGGWGGGDNNSSVFVNSFTFLQNQEQDIKPLHAVGKTTEDTQASNGNVPSVDNDDCVVLYNSTTSNTTQVKPIENELETELKPTTIEEARLMCEKYSKRICETSGENPKINMINVKVELTSGDTYTSNNINYRKFFKPFIVLSDSRYNCQICEATLNTRDAIVKHIGTHFNLFPYCCKFCDKRYTLLPCANAHIKLHSSKLVCEQCGAVFKAHSSLIKHVQIHDKPFCCHDCGKSFSSKDRIRCHILKEHMKIRTFACKICGKAYFYESNVATHMIFAHADRKIECEHCGKMYFRNNMLKEHMKRYHN